MARRPAASIHPPDVPLSLQKAFDACQKTEVDPETGGLICVEEPAEAVVGQRLREIRQKQGFSIRALAARSGLAINTLSMIENGRTSPSVSTLQILARVLEVPIAVFFEQEAVEKKVVFVPRNLRPAVTVDTTRLEHLGKDLAGQCSSALRGHAGARFWQRGKNDPPYRARICLLPERAGALFDRGGNVPARTGRQSRFRIAPGASLAKHGH
jgi:transcriptional regulator with XRE-family HTH domain